jgi:hypothetical protein
MIFVGLACCFDFLVLETLVFLVLAGGGSSLSLPLEPRSSSSVGPRNRLSLEREEF